MEITSKDHDLASYISNYAKAIKDLGPRRAKILQKRIAQLEDANSLEDTRALSTDL